MKKWIAFWNILLKDIRSYYLKPPNISWGIIFPLAWTGMFLIRSGSSIDSIPALLPGLMAISILFGTTSMMAVTVTFEKKNSSFDRLLLAPISFDLLMLAKTSGAIFFGMINAVIPLLLASLFSDIRVASWPLLILAVFLISTVSTFLGLLIAIAVREVFEAQTLSNFFRFPMIFLCGLFLPVSKLPIFIRPLSYILPLTYGVDIMRGLITGGNLMYITLSFAVLTAFCVLIFSLNRYFIKKRWII